MTPVTGHCFPKGLRDHDYPHGAAELGPLEPDSTGGRPGTAVDPDVDAVDPRRDHQLDFPYGRRNLYQQYREPIREIADQFD